MAQNISIHSEHNIFHLNIHNTTVRTCTHQIHAFVQYISEHCSYLIDLAFGTRLGFVSLTDIDNEPSHSVQFGNCILLLGDQDLVMLISEIEPHMPQSF